MLYTGNRPNQEILSNFHVIHLHSIIWRLTEHELPLGNDNIAIESNQMKSTPMFDHQQMKKSVISRPFQWNEQQRNVQNRGLSVLLFSKTPD
jgi:hypothetical protein